VWSIYLARSKGFERISYEYSREPSGSITFWDFTGSFPKDFRIVSCRKRDTCGVRSIAVESEL
jgi:hypothetical protein